MILILLLSGVMTAAAAAAGLEGLELNCADLEMKDGGSRAAEAL